RRVRISRICVLAGRLLAPVARRARQVVLAVDPRPRFLGEDPFQALGGGRRFVAADRLLYLLIVEVFAAQFTLGLGGRLGLERRLFDRPRFFGLFRLGRVLAAVTRMGALARRVVSGPRGRRARRV